MGKFKLQFKLQVYWTSFTYLHCPYLSETDRVLFWITPFQVPIPAVSEHPAVPDVPSPYSHLESCDTFTLPGNHEETCPGPGRTAVVQEGDETHIPKEADGVVPG